MATNSDQIALNPAVFNWQDYLARYEDLRKAGLHDQAGAQSHWLTAGIKEGRQGSATFWSSDYVALYPDLSAAFGNDHFKAIEHYVLHGIGEGRHGVRVAASSAPA